VARSTKVIINREKDEKMKKRTITFLLMVLATGLVYPSSAEVQNKTKRTVSEMHLHPEGITHPVEYSNLKIRGKSSEFSSMFEKGNKRLEKPLRPETEFEEDDDFWEHLSFDVTNVSEKTIVYLDTAINLYARDVIQRMTDKNRDHEAFAQEDVAGMAIEFGDHSNFDPPYTWSLKPGESTTITIDPEMRDFVRRQILQFSSPVIRVGMHTSLIFFADGSSWSFSGVVNPPESKNKQSGSKSPAVKRESRQPFCLACSLPPNVSAISAIQRTRQGISRSGLQPRRWREFRRA